MRRTAPAAALVTTLISTLLAAGCVAPATVTRSDGSQLEAIILGHDGDALVVREDGGSVITRVPTDAIVDIDHPGNLEMAVGSVTVALGLAATVLGGLVLAGGGLASGAGFYFLGPGLALFGLGTGVAINGVVIWTRSRDALGYRFDAGATLAPWVAPHGEDLAGGAGLSVRF